jgi:ribosome biogenesis GTPase
LNLKVGKISKYWDTGKHTTSFSQMFRLPMGGYVIDTPGIRTFRVHDVPTENLRDLFPEFAPFQARCHFPSCTHDHEPDCAVFDAVDRGELAASRYASYVEMLDERREGTGDGMEEGAEE